MASINGERLSPEHLRHLVDSAIHRAVIDARGYETFHNTRGFPPAVRKLFPDVPGMLIPIRTTQGEIGTYQYRLDYPEPHPVTGKVTRYLNPAGGVTCLDTPAAALPFLRDMETDLWITEGAKKVDSAVSNGILCTIGLLGVAMWQRDGMALPDWKDIALKGRRVVIAFDSDVMTNPKVRAQLDSLGAWLHYRGARVGYCILPSGEGVQ